MKKITSIVFLLIFYAIASFGQVLEDLPKCGSSDPLSEINRIADPEAYQKALEIENFIRSQYAPPQEWSKA